MDHGGALPDVVLEAAGLDQTITAGIKLVRPSEN
jgi:threonine dehydrogenase-like Zn-dependent dehydrogenase